ncbi:MAG TPA: helix-turn-helix domain-containing protein [Candidatus Limnocylindria bacterium]|nr:helix-turn-helix domain-containing protein [Candidatus Limnocylindria bacterium]
MKAGVLRRQLAAAVEAALRTREAEAIAVTADRAKAMGVAMSGVADDAEIEVAGLELSTRMAATVLGFHPEHVRRLIRAGRIPARRIGGDYRIRVDDLWPILQARSGMSRARAT